MIAERVANVLRVCAERGEDLTIGAVYNVARDVLSARVGSCVGTYYHTAGNDEAPTGLRVEIRDSTNPGEVLLYIVNRDGRRVAQFGVMANRDFEAKETIAEVLAAFDAQAARVAA